MSDWYWKFPFYRSEAWANLPEHRVMATKRLDPVSYWLIKLIHGNGKLNSMGATACLVRELGGKYDVFGR